ncbi:sulfur carrier protein ThiS [bacterium]|nr:sulfur carrier protein ThiS [bacterium]
MKILINGQIIEIQKNMTLKELVDKKNLPNEKGVAIAINEEIIAKTDWETTILKENDNVLMFGAIQGG